MLKVYENTAPVTALELAAVPRDQILIQGLVLDVFIGVFDHEYLRPQPVRFDVTIELSPLELGGEADMKNILRYDHIIADIKAIIAAGHIDLVETLAEQIAAACLAYERAAQVSLCAVKLTAFDEAESVGVKITRRA